MEYRSAVAAQKYLRERRCTAFWHHYTLSTQYTPDESSVLPSWHGWHRSVLTRDGPPTELCRPTDQYRSQCDSERNACQLMTDDASPLASGQWRRDIICVTVVSGDREDDIQASTGIWWRQTFRQSCCDVEPSRMAEVIWQKSTSLVSKRNRVDIYYHIRQVAARFANLVTVGAFGTPISGKGGRSQELSDGNWKERRWFHIGCPLWPYL